jgi:tRNA A-37 threonylcarbamoyl transferase component Bud32/Tol biopolymer transport system component
MPCPPEEQLIRLVDGKLSAAEAEAVRAHLEGCVSCRAAVGAFVKDYHPAPVPAAATAPAAHADLAQAPTKALPPHAPTAIGPFTVLALIGAGGMGEVYRARDARLGRDVAIKVLPARVRTEPEWLLRFQRETRVIGQLNHPNVLSVYDVGSSAGAPYVVTELLEGETLRHRLVGQGPLPPALALRMARDLAEGLAAAHKKGIVHRDLKPENIFLTSDGRVKILDFGLAKQSAWRESPGETDLNTRSGAILGTVGYMAPEQVRGRPADARADVFCVGAVLYEMLTGKRAFSGESEIEAMHAILTDEPPPIPPSPDLPVGALTVLRRCLEKDAERRYPSAAELALELTALTSTPSGLSTLPLYAARPRLGFAVLGGAVLLATAVAAGVVWRGRSSGPAAAAEVTRRRITDAEGAAAVNHVGLSPDGKLAVYVDWRGQVHVVVTATGEAHELPLKTDTSNAVFLADGVTVAAEVCPAGETDCRLALVSAFGGQPTEVARLPAGYLAALGSDRLLVMDQKEDSIWVCSTRGQDRRRLYRAPPGGRVNNLETAPGAATVAVYDQLEKQLRFISTRDGALTGVIDDLPSLSESGMVWSGDRRFLYAVVEGNVLTHVYEVPIGAGGEVAGPARRVYTFDGRIELGAASADGHQVVYVRRERRFESYVAALSARDLGPPARLSSDLFDDVPYGWSPDGKSVLLGSTRPSSVAVVLAPANGAPPTTLADGVRPVLAPDGLNVLFMRDRAVGTDNHTTLFAVPLAGGPPTELVDLGQAPADVTDWLSCPLPPSTRPCLLAVARERDVHHTLLDPHTGKRTPVPTLPEGPEWTTRISPAGDAVVRSPDRSRVEVIQIDDGRRTEIAHETCLIHRVAWAPDGRSVLASCVHPALSPSYLLRYDLDSGARTVLAETPFVFTRLAVAPDGQRLAYSVNAIGGTMWIAEGL